MDLGWGRREGWKKRQPFHEVPGRSFFSPILFTLLVNFRDSRPPFGVPQWTQESCPGLYLAAQALCPPGGRRLQATQAQSGFWALGGQQWWSQREFDTKSQPFVSQAFHLGKLKAISNHVLQDLSPQRQVKLEKFCSSPAGGLSGSPDQACSPTPKSPHIQGLS